MLLEALPYIREFAGDTIVIKYGGAAMVDDALRESFARDVVLLKYVGLHPVIVHGGGPQVTAVSAQLGIETTFVHPDDPSAFEKSIKPNTKLIYAETLGNPLINIVDLVMTITALASGVSGGMQRQIEGSSPNGMNLNDYIDYIESQRPWEAAADLATPKPGKISVEI